MKKIIIMFLTLVFIINLCFNKTFAMISENTNEMQTLFEQISKSQSKIEIEDYYYSYFDSNLPPNIKNMLYVFGSSVDQKVKDFIFASSQKKILQCELTQAGRGLYKHGDLKDNPNRIEGFYYDRYREIIKRKLFKNEHDEAINSSARELVKKLVFDEKSLWCSLIINDQETQKQVRLVEIWSSDILSDNMNDRRQNAYAIRFYVDDVSDLIKSGDLRGWLEYVDKEKCIDLQKKKEEKEIQAKKLLEEQKRKEIEEEKNFNEALSKQRVEELFKENVSSYDDYTNRIKDKIERKKKELAERNKKLEQQREYQQKEKEERKKKRQEERLKAKEKQRQEDEKALEEILATQTDTFPVEEKIKTEIQEMNQDISKLECEAKKREKISAEIKKLLNQLNASEFVDIEWAEKCALEFYGGNGKAAKRFIQIIEWRNLCVEAGIEFAKIKRDLLETENIKNIINKRSLKTRNPIIIKLCIQKIELLIKKEKEKIALIEKYLTLLPENPFNNSYILKLIESKKDCNTHIENWSKEICEKNKLIESLLSENGYEDIHREDVVELLSKKLVSANDIREARELVKKIKSVSSSISIIDYEMFCCENGITFKEDFLETTKEMSIYATKIARVIGDTIREIEELNQQISRLCKNGKISEYIASMVKNHKNCERAKELVGKVENPEIDSKSDILKELEEIIKPKKLETVKKIILKKFELLEKKQKLQELYKKREVLTKLLLKASNTIATACKIPKELLYKLEQSDSN